MNIENKKEKVRRKSETCSITLNNTILGGKYTIDQKISVGRYAHVYRGLNTEDSKHYSIKFYNF